MSGSKFPHTEFFTRFVAYLNPSSLSPYQPIAGSSPGPCSLSEQSNLVVPTDPQGIQAPVELVSAVTQPTRSLVPGTVYVVDLPRYRSRGTPPVLIVSAAGTWSELVRLGVDLSAVVVFAGPAVFVAEIATAAGLGLGVIGGLNHSVMM